MISSILTEIPPVSREECFAVFERHKTSFNFPIHVHSLFELNYICLLYTLTRKVIIRFP